MACSTPDKTESEIDVIAEINGLTVSADHFRNAFKEYYYRTGQVLAPDPETREAILNTQFNTYVLAVHAMDEGIDEQEETINQLKAIERRVLTEEYLEQIILADLEVTVPELRAYYLRFNTQLRASHLFGRTKEQIDQYYQRLQNGESFEELAKEAFQNDYLANNGGDIGRFTTDDLDIAFENAAFALKEGEISEPVRTAQGYSIIKITDRVTKPIITESEFNQNRDQLESYVYKKKKELAIRDHLFNFSENVVLTESADELWETFDDNYALMTQKDPEFITNLYRSNTILANFKEFEFSQSQFVEEYLASSSAMLNSISDKASFINFIKGVAYRAYMVQGAKEAQIDDQELVQASIDETYYTYLANQVNRRIEASIDFTPAELFEAYQENRDNFYTPLQVSMQRIVLSDEDQANRLRGELTAGANFTEAVSTFTTNNEDRFTNGELGFQSIKEYGFNSTALARLEVGELSEVLQYSENEFHIYKMLDRMEAKPMSFAEAQPMVDQFLTRKKLQELRARLIEDVKEKHNAVVDLEKLNELTIQI